MFILFYLLFSIAVGIIDGIIGMPALGIIYTLALLVPSISIAARRLHDTGRTGWWQLIAFIPVIGFFVLIFFLVQDSQGENQYGPSPKLLASA